MSTHLKWLEYQAQQAKTASMAWDRDVEVYAEDLKNAIGEDAFESLVLYLHAREVSRMAKDRYNSEYLEYQKQLIAEQGAR